MAGEYEDYNDEDYEEIDNDDEYEDVNFFETEEYYQWFYEALQIQIALARKHGLITDDQDYLTMIKNDVQIQNLVVMIFSVFASMYSQIRNSIVEVYNSFDVNVAIEEDLDCLGDLIGVSRDEGSYASVSLSFTLSTEHNETIKNPPGVVVSSSSDIEYETEEELVFPVGISECTVLATAKESGAGQNVKEGTLTLIKEGLSKDINCTVTNKEKSTGGSSFMEDEEFRDIIKSNYMIHRRGTLSSYTEYLNSYDGINSYKLNPLWNGAGTIKIVIDASDDTDYHIKQITEDILEDICVADEDVTVMKAEKEYIKINIVANVETHDILEMSDTEKESIKSKIIDAVFIYMNGGTNVDSDVIKGMGIGEDFIPFRLGVFVDGEIDEIKNLEIIYPKSIIKSKEDKVFAIEKKEDIEITINN